MALERAKRPTNTMDIHRKTRVTQLHSNPLFTARGSATAMSGNTAKNRRSLLRVDIFSVFETKMGEIAS
jgi:hypothetical protein